MKKDRIQVGECEGVSLHRSSNPSDTPDSSRARHHDNRTDKAGEGYGDDDHEIFRSVDERRTDLGMRWSPNLPAGELGMSDGGGVTGGIALFPGCNGV